MKIKEFLKGIVLCAAFILCPAQAEPPTGETSQPLRTDNPPVNGFDLERLGLIELKNAQNISFCSGALVTNLWVITAAHCVEDRNGGRLAVPGVISVIGHWRTVQTHAAVEIVNFRPIDAALVRLDTPMRVFGSERRFHAQLWRPADGDLRGHGVRVYGLGRSQMAGDAAHPAAASDKIYRWFDVTIRNIGSQSYSYPASRGQSVLGGDSGGPSFFDTRITGVHSLDTVHCANHRSSCDWDMVDNTYETWDAPVSLVADRIDAAIQRTAPPEWSQMTVKRNEFATDYIRPTVHLETDDYRLDDCRTFAADCGKAAADAFCAEHEAKFTGKEFFELEAFGHTAIGTTGRTCFGGGCRAFRKITCFTGRPSLQSKMSERPGAQLGAILPASPSGGAAVGPRCKSGFVWREARPADHVCVPPESRVRAAQENSVSASRADPKGAFGSDTCVQGFVWREAFDGDRVCVAPETRTIIREENRLGPGRQESSQ